MTKFRCEHCRRRLFGAIVMGVRGPICGPCLLAGKDTGPRVAYLVFHDAFDGSMEVWQERDLETARAKAADLQDRLDRMGYEECGCYRAYEALPKRKVWKMHAREHWGGIAGETGR